jgi:hypothetical protein
LNPSFAGDERSPGTVIQVRTPGCDPDKLANIELLWQTSELMRLPGEAALQVWAASNLLIGLPCSFDSVPLHFLGKLYVYRESTSISNVQMF